MCDVTFNFRYDGMEHDLLIDPRQMATNLTSRYRAVGANGILSERNSTSSTDDEMIDIAAADLPHEYQEYPDLADKSQGRCPSCDNIEVSLLTPFCLWQVELIW